MTPDLIVRISSFDMMHRMQLLFFIIFKLCSMTNTKWEDTKSLANLSGHTQKSLAKLIWPDKMARDLEFQFFEILILIKKNHFF